MSGPYRILFVVSSLVSSSASTLSPGSDEMESPFKMCNLLCGENPKRRGYALHCAAWFTVLYSCASLFHGLRYMESYIQLWSCEIFMFSQFNVLWESGPFAAAGTAQAKTGFWWSFISQFLAKAFGHLWLSVIGLFFCFQLQLLSYF
ncbi:hypothetical protein QBC45DRAFT_178197 [Copromyces sp. CBS 386.78]|nr:hypothetical protein QBC45DRAFT_178197 [Copromyces sp. CBS 386.78]